MSGPLRVSSKVKLAQALGISPPTLYAYLRLPDSPPPRNGYYYVSDWRKFITKKRAVMQTSEKQQLELELLRAKVAREQHGLDEARETTRDRIIAELEQTISALNQTLRTELYRMRYELSPKFEGLSARQIFKLWGDRERQAFEVFCTQLRKRTGAKVTEEQTRPVTNVIQLQKAASA